MENTLVKEVVCIKSLIKFIINPSEMMLNYCKFGHLKFLKLSIKIEKGIDFLISIDLNTISIWKAE